MSNSSASSSSTSLHRAGPAGGNGATGAVPQPNASAPTPATPDRRGGVPGGAQALQQQPPQLQHLQQQTQPTSPTPPIVVVSPSQEVPSTSEVIQRTSLIPVGDASPRSQSLNRLRNSTPKDTIPIAGKPPRKQRSSRFHVTEHVEIERLPSFAGRSLILVSAVYTTDLIIHFN